MKLFMNAGLLAAFILSYFSCNNNPAPSPNVKPPKSYTLRWDYNCDVTPTYFDFGTMGPNGSTPTSIGHKQFSVCNGNSVVVAGNSVSNSANLKFYVRACISNNECGPMALTKPQ